MRNVILAFSAAALIFGAWRSDAKTLPLHPEKRMDRVVQSTEIRAKYTMRNSNEVVMYLGGTTPVKNWKMSAHGLQGEAQFVFSDNQELLGIDQLTFSLPVHNLKGEGAAMDEDAYTALKADRYKEITFVLKNAGVQQLGEHLFLINALGTLTVAGITRTVTLAMRSQMSSDGSISFSGAQILRMSDYNVERPSVLFGIIRAADEMTLTYNLVFQNR